MTFAAFLLYICDSSMGFVQQGTTLKGVRFFGRIGAVLGLGLGAFSMQVSIMRTICASSFLFNHWLVMCGNGKEETPFHSKRPRVQFLRCKFDISFSQLC